MTPQNETDLRKFLTPFADGELDVEQSLRVLEHMAMNPQATKRVMHQQQLRQSIGKYFADNSAAPPAELQNQLESLFPTSEPVLKHHRAKWQLPAMLVAAVAILFTGAWLGRATSHPQRSIDKTAASSPPAPTTQMVPTATVGTLHRTHVGCSRLTSHNHSKLFPDDFSELGPSVKNYLGIDVPLPAFDQINYRFVGAEPCPLPGGLTVHLLYRGKGATLHDSISVFVQRDTGQLSIPLKASFNASTMYASHPLYIWRSNGAVYYLIGNSAETVRRAAKISGAPT